MKVTKLEFHGEVYHLFYNSEAMLSIEEQLKQGTNLYAAINPQTCDGKRMLCEAVAIMAEQGELARRYYGYDHNKIPTVERLQLFTTPANVVELFEAAVRAITIGVGREISGEEKEVDLVLQQLQKKT